MGRAHHPEGKPTNPTHVHLTLKSKNQKTGPIPVSTSTRATCPETCPLFEEGCYALHGPLGLHWKKVSWRVTGDPWPVFCARIAALPEGQLWRHNQAGDLPGDRLTVNREELLQLVSANRGRRGFTYTHKFHERKNRTLIRQANAKGFVVNLSADSPRHADELLALDAGPVVCMLPEASPKVSKTPNGVRVVKCPAMYRDEVTCASCGLCARPRDYVIGFPVHGSQKRAAEAVATR